MNSRLMQCEYCGRIARLTRSDKQTCSNNCAVKLLYCRKHNYETPLETYLKMLSEAEDTEDGQAIEPVIKKEISRTTKKNIINDSELDEKINKYSIHLKQLKHGN